MAQVTEGVRSLGPAYGTALELLDGIPGDPQDLLLSGGSAVIAPDAGYITGPVVGEATILYADLDLGQIVEGHLALDTQGHYSRPDIFHLEVNDQPQSNVTFRSARGLVDPAASVRGEKEA